MGLQSEHVPLFSNPSAPCTECARACCFMLSMSVLQMTLGIMLALVEGKRAVEA